MTKPIIDAVSGEVASVERDPSEMERWQIIPEPDPLEALQAQLDQLLDALGGE